MQTTVNSSGPTRKPKPESGSFRVGDRVYFTGQPRRIGTVRYVGPVEGYSGEWVGVEWDADGEGKNDGSHNGVRYFTARGANTSSFVRSHNLSSGVSLLKALETRNRAHTTKEEEDLKELDLTGNLLSDWNDISIISEGLPALTELNLSNNSMSPVIISAPRLSNIHILVLNQTGVTWNQPVSSAFVRGFDTLKLLNLDGNCISSWDEIIKLAQLCSLEQLFLNNNNLNQIRYPNCDKLDEPHNECGSQDRSIKPFKSLRSLSLGGNNIEDLQSIDSLNFFPNLIDIRLSGNPVADIGKGGVPRFVFIARIAKLEMLNGSEVSARERKDSEIRYVRLVMSKSNDDSEETRRLHPRFTELKKIHGLDDERPSAGASGPQKMASGLISVTLKCVGASMGEKLPLVKKIPATTTVGKLKNLCESFFKLKSIKPALFLKEEGSPLPVLLEDDMAALVELGVGNDSTILVDELS